MVTTSEELAAIPMKYKQYCEPKSPQLKKYSEIKIKFFHYAFIYEKYFSKMDI